MEETKIEFHKQLFTKQKQQRERLEMIEGIYNIKPKDILASISLEKTEKTRAKRESIAIDNESPDRSPRH